VKVLLRIKLFKEAAIKDKTFEMDDDKRRISDKRI
jgi:hypothetical protein